MRYLRLVNIQEAEEAMELINQAKAYLKAQGIDQWQTGYPDEACIMKDIQHKKGYFMLSDEHEIIAYLCIDFDGEPAYEGLSGKWLSGAKEPYVVVHRLAIAESVRGSGNAAAAFRLTEQLALEKGVHYFRVDTDDQNVIMKHILQKQGFTYCGEIWFDNSVKIAYEKQVSC